jgi:acyl-CoA thioester hydrolase
MSRPFEVELEFKVGTYDIDFAGIVSNIVYLRWLEDLRLAMLEAHLPLEDQLAAGTTPVLLSTEIEYLHAVRLFQRPCGHIWVADVGRARWTLEAEITVEERVVARARQVLASVRLADFRPLPAPALLREAFRGRQQEAP